MILLAQAVPDLPDIDGASLLIFLLWGIALFSAGIFFCVRAWRAEPTASKNLVRPWNVSGYGFAMFIWLLLLAYFLASIAVGCFADGDEIENTALSAVFVQGSFAVALGLSAFFIKPGFTAELATVKRSPLNLFNEGITRFLASYPFLLFASLLTSGIFLLWQFVGFDYEPQPQELVMQLMQTDRLWPFAVFSFLTVLVAPVVEELLFRGVLYRFLKARLPGIMPLVLANALFGLIHWDLTAFLPLCAAGMLFTWAYERTGHIAVPIICHACLNANTMFLLLLPIEVS